METIEKIYTYEKDFKEFAGEYHSGRTIEIDEEMFFYWLEVLPPKFMNKIKEIDGVRRYVSFGFAEGREPIVYFWRENGRFFCKRSDIWSRE